MDVVNGNLKTVIWLTLEEASKVNFSGSSFTTPAFQKAMKSQLK
jgi:hypothetical protein